MIQDGNLTSLGAQKEVKPLLGDGEAFPTMFLDSLANSILLLCFDELSKYISVTDVLNIYARLDDPTSIVDDLIGALELPGGQLQDDVSVIVLMN